MRYSTTTGLVLAALGVGEVMAGPAHAHFHKKAHEKKDLADINWNELGIDWSSAWAAGQKTAAPTATQAAATTTAAAKAKATPAGAAFKEAAPSSSVGIADDLEDLFDGLVGASNTRTSFGDYYKIPGGSAKSGALSEGDNFTGNVGKPYGSNVMKVTSTSGYDFTATFINTQSKAITINVWNKGGPNYDNLSGASLAPKDTTLTFYLSPGAKQVVAFMKDSQIGWAEACSTNSWGAFDTTWGEANFVPTGSGFDVSAIPNSKGNTYNMSIVSKEVSCVSDMTQNMWLAAYTPVGGSDGSCYVPGSTMHLTVKMGGNVK